jgi:hypothetical protein
MSYLTDYYKKQCVLLEERLQYLSSEINTLKYNLSEADYSSAMDAMINMPAEEFEAKIKGHPQEGMGRSARMNGRAAMGLPPDPPRGRSASSSTTSTTIGSIGKKIASQFPTKLSQYPAETAKYVKDAIVSLNPVKLTPGKKLPVGLNPSGLRNIGGLGGGLAASYGANTAMDALDIKNEFVRQPIDWAAFAAGDQLMKTGLTRALVPATFGGAAAGLAAIAGYKTGEYIGDKTGLHDAIGNQLGGASNLNTTPTGIPGGTRTQILKNAKEDPTFKITQQGKVK